MQQHSKRSDGGGWGTAAPRAWRYSASASSRCSSSRADIISRLCSLQRKGGSKGGPPIVSTGTCVGMANPAMQRGEGARERQSHLRMRACSPRQHADAAGFAAGPPGVASGRGAGEARAAQNACLSAARACSHACYNRCMPRCGHPSHRPPERCGDEGALWAEVPRHGRQALLHLVNVLPNSCSRGTGAGALGPSTRRARCQRGGGVTPESQQACGCH